VTQHLHIHLSHTYLASFRTWVLSFITGCKWFTWDCLYCTVSDVCSSGYCFSPVTTIQLRMRYHGLHCFYQHKIEPILVCNSCQILNTPLTHVTCTLHYYLFLACQFYIHSFSSDGLKFFKFRRTSHLCFRKQPYNNVNNHLNITKYLYTPSTL